MRNPAKKSKKNKGGPPAGMPVSVFLKKEMVAAARKPEVYDLESEFAATRKNRGTAIYVSLLVIFILLMGLTFGITSFIEYRNRSIAIEISDFEDINMRELLNAVRSARGLIDGMQREMDQMQGKMDLEIERARRKAQEDLVKLKKRHSLSETQRALEMKRIQAERDRRISEARASYKSRIREKEKSIASEKQRLAEYRSDLREQVDGYVGKMENRLKQYMGESKASRADAELLVKQMGENYMEKHREEKKEYEEKLRDLAVQMKEVQAEMKGSSDKTGELEDLIALYRKALMHYAFLRGEQGHVVSILRGGVLLVVLNPMVEVTNPCRGIVLDKKGALIARIEITTKKGVARAVVTKRLSGTPISPFDMIIVQR